MAVGVSGAQAPTLIGGPAPSQEGLSRRAKEGWCVPGHQSCLAPARRVGAASPLPAGQDDALEHVRRPTGRHLQPLHVVPEVVLDGGQGLAHPRGPLEGAGSPQPEKTTLPVLFHEKS